MEKSASDLARFYCPEHEIGIKDGNYYCSSGKHFLTLEFPPVEKNFLKYCCGCQRFIPLDIARNDKENKCLSCDKTINARYFCSGCQTLINDVTKEINDKKCHISAEGNLLPECPACKTKTKSETLHIHDCKVLKIEFYTSRMFCPFCRKSAFQTFEGRIAELQERLSNYENSSAEQEFRNEISSAFNRIKAVEEYILKIYLYLDQLKESNSSKSLKLYEIDGITKDIREKPDKINQRSSDVLHNEFRNTENRSFQYVLKDEVKEPLVQEQVSDILNNYPQKVALTRSIYQMTLKKITSTEEAVFYYGIAVGENTNTKYYVIPSITKVNNALEYETLIDFYAFDKSTSNRLNGKLKVKIPAEVSWNDRTQGWQLIKKGLIRIGS